MIKCTGCGIESDKELCNRCFNIIHYNQHIKSNNNIELSMLNLEKNFLVHIVDLFDLNNMKEYNDLGNDKILVITKRDLFIKSLNENKVIANFKKLHPNYLDYIFISSINNHNMDEFYKLIKNKKKVYFIGNTNSGKSTLINALIKNYSNLNIKLTTSNYINTTLKNIEIKLKDLVIVDTPGVLNKKSFFNINEDYKKLIIKKRMKPFVFQISKPASIYIDNYCKVSFYDENNIVIYCSNSLNVVRRKLVDCSNSVFLKKDEELVIDNLFILNVVNDCKISIDNEYYYVRKRLL